MVSPQLNTSMPTTSGTPAVLPEQSDSHRMYVYVVNACFSKNQLAGAAQPPPLHPFLDSQIDLGHQRQAAAKAHKPRARGGSSVQYKKKTSRPNGKETPPP